MWSLTVQTFDKFIKTQCTKRWQCLLSNYTCVLRSVLLLLFVSLLDLRSFCVVVSSVWWHEQFVFTIQLATTMPCWALSFLVYRKHGFAREWSVWRTILTLAYEKHTTMPPCRLEGDGNSIMVVPSRWTFSCFSNDHHGSSHSPDAATPGLKSCVTIKHSKTAMRRWFRVEGTRNHTRKR